jgi:hypothetical protein
VRVDYTVVGGRFVVKHGRLVNLDEVDLVRRQNEAAKRLLNG